VPDKDKCPTKWSISTFLSNLAGDESDGWHPLVADFILVARKLEKLGFIYHRGNVIIINSSDELAL
jgi:hypothetical protein